MGRPVKEPVRALTDEERQVLEQLSQASSAPAVQVVRAKLLLHVAAGLGHGAAAAAEGRRSGEAVTYLVQRFNADGLLALEPRHGGGPAVEYGPAERERIVTEVRRAPDREADGTATWSVGTLQRVLRRSEDGLPRVSRETIFKTLHDAGWSWQKDRSWCETGKVLRKRKTGIIQVTDPRTEEKKR